MAFHFSPRIVTDNLVMYIDPQNDRSVSIGSLTASNLLPKKGNLTSHKLLSGAYVNQLNSQRFFTLDGSDDYIDAVGSPIEVLSPNMTFCAWINHDRSYIGQQGSILFFGGSGGSTQRCYFRVNLDTIQMALTNGTVSTLSSTSLYTSLNYPNNFNYVCVSISENVGLGTTSVKFYVNGVLLEQTTSSVVNSRSSSLSSLNEPRIGYGGSSAAQRFSGDIASIKIYEKTLSQLEILQNYNSTKSKFGL
jgi:hypothetical protein